MKDIVRHDVNAVHTVITYPEIISNVTEAICMAVAAQRLNERIPAQTKPTNKPKLTTMCAPGWIPFLLIAKRAYSVRFQRIAPLSYYYTLLALVPRRGSVNEPYDRNRYDIPAHIPGALSVRYRYCLPKVSTSLQNEC